MKLLPITILSVFVLTCCLNANPIGFVSFVKNINELEGLSTTNSNNEGNIPQTPQAWPIPFFTGCNEEIDFEVIVQPGLTYLWSDGTIGPTTSCLLTPSDYSIVLTVVAIDENGCESEPLTVAAVNTCNVAPVNFDCEACNFICIGKFVYFNDVPTALQGDIISWEWDFGNEQVNNFFEEELIKENPYFRYIVDGVFTVSLTRVDEFGEIESLVFPNHIIVENIINWSATATVCSQGFPSIVTPPIINNIVNNYFSGYQIIIKGPNFYQASQSNSFNLKIPEVGTYEAIIISNTCGCVSFYDLIVEEEECEYDCSAPQSCSTAIDVCIPLTEPYVFCPETCEGFNVDFTEIIGLNSFEGLITVNNNECIEIEASEANTNQEIEVEFLNQTDGGCFTQLYWLQFFNENDVLPLLVNGVDTVEVCGQSEATFILEENPNITFYWSDGTIGTSAICQLDTNGIGELSVFAENENGCPGEEVTFYAVNTCPELCLSPTTCVDTSFICLPTFEEQYILCPKTCQGTLNEFTNVIKSDDGAVELDNDCFLFTVNNGINIPFTSDITLEFKNTETQECFLQHYVLSAFEPNTFIPTAVSTSIIELCENEDSVVFEVIDQGFEYLWEDGSTGLSYTYTFGANDFCQTSVVAINQYGCKSDSLHFQATIVECEAVNNTPISISTFNIGPNPFNKYLNINLQNLDEEIGVKIYSITGQKVIEENVLGKSLVVETSNIPAGIYILNLQVGDEQQAIKLQKVE